MESFSKLIKYRRFEWQVTLSKILITWRKNKPIGSLFSYIIAIFLTNLIFLIIKFASIKNILVDHIEILGEGSWLHWKMSTVLFFPPFHILKDTGMMLPVFYTVIQELKYSSRICKIKVQDLFLVLDVWVHCSHLFLLFGILCKGLCSLSPRFDMKLCQL